MGQNNSIHPKSACLVISDDFAAPAAATICSLLIHNPGVWNVFVISDNLSDANQNKLTQVVKQYSAYSEFIFLKAGMDNFSYFPNGIITKHVSQHALFKFLIAELLPVEIDRVLYLDSDLVVTGSVQEFFIVQSTLPISAIKDFGYHNKRKKFGIASYFNSGVMLLNLVVWRKNELSQKILVSEIPEWNKFVDQDILNNFFKENWQPLDGRFNVPASVLYSKRVSQLGFLKNEARIVHFLGGLKPWDYWLNYSLLYWRYILKTPYKWTALRIPLTILRSLFYILKRLKK